MFGEVGGTVGWCDAFSGSVVHSKKIWVGCLTNSLPPTLEVSIHRDSPDKYVYGKGQITLYAGPSLGVEWNGMEFRSYAF